MRDRLEIVNDSIELTQGTNKTKLGITEVLSRYGTLAMVALDQGEIVWVSSERKDDWKNERFSG
jgi:hypothetical protein